MKIPILASMLALASSLAHCPGPSRCTPGESRCIGNAAEICSANGSFHELADCDQVSRQSGAPFVCEFVDESTENGRVTGHTCVPETDAGAQEGDAR